LSSVYWHITRAFQTLGRVRQEDCDSDTSQDFIVETLRRKRRKKRKNRKKRRKWRNSTYFIT
jgi:hypothetical protein